MGLKQLSCHLMGGSAGSEHGLEAFAEINAVQLKGRKPLKLKRKRKQRHQQSAEAQALYTIDFTTGSMQVS